MLLVIAGSRPLMTIRLNIGEDVRDEVGDGRGDRWRKLLCPAELLPNQAVDDQAARQPVECVGECDRLAKPQEMGGCAGIEWDGLGPSLDTDHRPCRKIGGDGIDHHHHIAAVPHFEKIGRLTIMLDDLHAWLAVVPEVANADETSGIIRAVRIANADHQWGGRFTFVRHTA